MDWISASGLDSALLAVAGLVVIVLGIGFVLVVCGLVTCMFSSKLSQREERIGRPTPTPPERTKGEGQ